ncbi:hypothetical protein B0H10DRAFT_2242510 [Mycena sp. CBHHK59/15]|nr:hypothetical protein B0H10DRAFT_2242510 [Mycena sp. CBHHK59/15]
MGAIHLRTHTSFLAVWRKPLSEIVWLAGPETGDRELCLTNWTKNYPQGSADEFKAYWDNLSNADKQPWTDPRKRALAAMTQASGERIAEDQKAKVVHVGKYFFVDLWKHRIDIDPSIKLPTRISQHPLTEKQKEWFYNILDEMEAAHVIQRVPGEFLECF